MTSQSYFIKSFCKIKNSQVSINDTLVFNDEDSINFSEFIKSAYRNLDIKYPKFFKMDALSKLAFLAADILLKEEQLDPEKENNIALVLSNKSSSISTDRKHQKSIQDKEDYFPSPAVFVYTLPNICLGEISIKHKLNSENSFFIFENFNATHLHSYTEALLKANKADKVLCGWVEQDGENYEAFIYLVSKRGKQLHNTTEIENKYYK